MNYRKMLFVLNPRAGRGSVREQFLELIDGFVRAGYDVTVHTSQKPQEVTSYLSECAGEYEMLVSCGGDGTLHETVNGLMRCPEPPPLCYIPAGTVNDFASSLGIPRDMIRAGKLVEDGVPFCCDIGQLGERYFSYVAAFGAFTDVSYQTPQQSKQLFGKLAYIAEGLKRLPNLTPYRLRVSWGTQELEGEFLYGMVSNSTSVAGLRLAEKHIYLNDGLFEVVLVRNPRSLSEQQALLNGLLRQEAVPGLLYLFRTPRVVISAEEALPWTLDGEFGGDIRQAEIVNRQAALRVLVSRDASLPAE